MVRMPHRSGMYALQRSGKFEFRGIKIIENRSLVHLWMMGFGALTPVPFPMSAPPPIMRTLNVQRKCPDLM